MYPHSGPQAQGVAPKILAPDPGVPTPADLQEVRERRLAMRANGYSPLSAHTPSSPFVAPDRRGKQPLTEVINGEKQPWTKGHSERRLMRVTVHSANTGLLLGTASLIALDIDANKKAAAAVQQQFMLDILRLLLVGDQLGPQLRRALLRLRAPSSTLLLLRAVRPMTKMKVAGERGAVELLGEGQQCLVDGWHPLSLAGPPIRWTWYNDRAPWNTPVAALPVIPNEELTALMDRIGASGQLGPAVARPTTTTAVVAGGGRRRVSAYPATDRLGELLKQHNALVMPAVRELIEEVGKAGEGRHDAIFAICGRLIQLRWPYQQAVDWLTPIVNESFNDGDWTNEVERALSHARNRQNAQLAKEKSVVNPAVWSNSNV